MVVPKFAITVISILVWATTLHCVTSGIWFLSKIDEMAQPTLFAHNLFYLPVVAAEFFGITLTPDGLAGLIIQDSFIDTLYFGTIGPSPCLATVAWCLLLGITIVMLRYRIVSIS